jgi:aminoglycoside phosphotransferase (APT) family kinase protein
MTTPPPAQGVRPDWDALPLQVRSAVEGWLGEPVVEAATQAGGFSPGVAARLRTAGGRRAFLKAVGPEPNPDSARFHRREARIAAALPPTAPVPRLLWSYDEGNGGWVALLYEDIAGRQPRIPWQDDDLDRVLVALGDLADALTPSPVPEAIAGLLADEGLFQRAWWGSIVPTPPDTLDPWSTRHLALLAELESQASAAARGDTLLHIDLRADNLLLTADRVVVVDWPHARIGAAWVDPLFMAPSVAMQGGPDPATFFARHPTARDADPDAVTSVIALMAGFFTTSALQPPPPGLPTLRAFQEAQGRVSRRWLAERLSLPWE